MNTSKHTSRRRGVTTMEFGLILPFVFFMLMGMIEFGTMFYSWMTLQKAAQTGARFASTGVGEDEGTRMTQIVQVTEDWLDSLNNGNKEIVIRYWPSASAAGDGIDGNAGGPCQLVEVDVRYAYQPFTPILSALFPDVIELAGHDRKLNEPWKPCND